MVVELAQSFPAVAAAANRSITYNDANVASDAQDGALRLASIVGESDLPTVGLITPSRRPLQHRLYRACPIAPEGLRTMNSDDGPEKTRFRQAVDASGEVIFMTDTEGVFTFVNSQFCRVYGYAAEEVVGRLTPRVLSSGMTADEQYASVWQRLKSGETIEVAFVNRTKDDRQLHVEATLNPIWDEAHAIVGFLAIERDVTARRAAEEAIRFQQTLFETERQLTLDGILVVDESSIVLSFNRRFQQMWDIPEEVLGTRADARLLQAVKEKLRDPHGFMREVQRLYDRHDEVSTDEVQLLDGRVFERYSAPMVGTDRRYYGRVWYFRDVTERKQAEVALRRERDRAQRYLDVADVMLLALDLRGRITLINRKGCALLGWREDELLGRDWIATCLPEWTRDASREALRALQAGDLSGVENPVLTKSGQERLIAWRNTTVMDAQGQITGTFSSGEDITDRRDAENALGESQAQLQMISDNVLDLVCQIRLDGTLVYVSPSYQAVLGYSPTALLGTSAFSLVHAEDLPGVQAAWADIVRRRSTGRAEFRCRHADGRYIWVETVGKLLFEAGEEPSGAILSSRDITERKRGEEIQREFDRRLQLAVASADMAVFAQDRDLRYTWIHNPQVGMDPTQVVGRTDGELLPADVAERLGSIKRRVLGLGERVRDEMTVEHDGQPHVFEVIVEPLRNARGQVEGITGVSIDITARRQLEAQLRQAQKLEALGSLAGGIAHDFNNLLTAIIGYAGLAIAELEPESRLRQDLEEVLQAGRSAESLTRQLLIFSRKDVVRPVPVRLADMVGRLERMLSRVVGEHVRFDVSLRHDTGFVRADVGQLEQVLMNLVVNARDAMPSGGVLSITTGSVELDSAGVRAAGGSTAGMYELLTVADTGVGMTPAVQAQIFDPFFTTKGPEKGTGLGLATVHGIVKQAGGLITVVSEPQRGSTFRIFLPRTPDTTGAVSKADDTAVQLGRRETILFVEDNTSIRTMAVRSLQRYGYVVLPAGDAKEAMAYGAEELGRLDLVVTDIVMPGMNGRQLAEQLQHLNQYIKVVFTSGFTEDSELLDGVRSGDTPFLQKPYTLESLAGTIRQVLDAG
jgi:two-component system cell cycle sensor histidine kinase/response regulator CckA